MSFGGKVFVTPHAVRQFQRRIAPLPPNHALAAIIHSVARPRTVKQLHNGRGIAVRTEAPFRIRAIVTPPTEPGRLPSVVTVLWG